MIFYFEFETYMKAKITLFMILILTNDFLFRDNLVCKDDC
jgi:hypothetical protein